MEVHNPAASDLKCPTCCIAFAAAQQHKEHYKSDYHRYNLKRKMVKLAPVSLDQFLSKKAYEAEQEEAQSLKCGECGKKFASTNTFNQHIQSKKHNPNMTRQSQQLPKKEAPFQKNPLKCIFCRVDHGTFAENIRHMQSAHSFFIAQPAYCTNEQGLVGYLQEKVEIGFMCIQCENKNAKDFITGEAVRKHMMDKGHCFMKVEDGYDEYLDYYDFSSQFNAIVEDQKDRYVPGIEYTTLQVVTKADKQQDQQDEADWEDEDEGSEDEDEEEVEVEKEGEGEQWQSDSGDDGQQQIKQKEQKKEKKSSTTTYHIMRPTHTPTGELLLPNGKILGHRKYRYLYRQTIRPFWMNNTLKMLGYQSNSNTTNNALICREKLMELVKMDRVMWKSKNKWERGWVKDGMRNNGLQKYFRIQNSM